MSGHKRATINFQRSDHIRFAQVSRQLENVERDYQEVKARISQIQSGYMQSSIDSLQSRQAEYTACLAQLDNQVSQQVGRQFYQVEYDLSNAIINHANQVYEQVTSLGTSLQQETSALIEQQSLALQLLFDESLAQQQAELDEIHYQLAEYAHQQHYKRQAALEALQSAAVVVDSLRAAYDLERFFPGRNAAFENELQTSQQNTTSGFFEASLAGSQQICLQAVLLRTQLEGYFLQHSILCSAALAKGMETLSLYDSHARVHAVDLEGSLLDVEIDVDHWSWGEWREQRQRCQRLVQRLQRNSDSLEIPAVEQVFQQIMACSAALPEIVGQARENVLASQVRYNLAECIVSSLKEQGFYLAESEYEDADQRRPYRTALTNLEGSRVLVTLSPKPDTPILHNLDLVSEDCEVRTPHELRKRAKTLRSALNSYGLQVNFTSLDESEPVPANPATFAAKPFKRTERARQAHS